MHFLGRYAQDLADELPCHRHSLLFRRLENLIDATSPNHFDLLGSCSECRFGWLTNMDHTQL
jgi:hypothetical protein